MKAMTTLQLRKKVHEYVDRVDDDVLEMLLAMLKVKVEDKPMLMSERQLKVSQQRLKQYKAGELETMAVNEAEQALYARRKKRGKKS